MTNTVGAIWLGGTARRGKASAGAIEVSKARSVAGVLVRQLLTTALWAIVCPAVSLSQASPHRSNRNAAGRAWRARYVEGTVTVTRRGRQEPLPAESRVKMRFEEDRILVFRRKRVLSFPAKAVTELDYRPEVFSRSRQVFGPEGVTGAIGRCADSPGFGPALCVVVALPMFAASAPFHYREHFVHITWRISAPTRAEYDDTEQEMDLRVGKGDVRGLIEALERVTGKKCGGIEPRVVGR